MVRTWIDSTARDSVDYSERVDIDTCIFEGECITLRTNEGIALQQYGTAGVGNTSATIIFTVE